MCFSVNFGGRYLTSDWSFIYTKYLINFNNSEYNIKIMRTSKVSETIQQYFKNTTLHGFKYLCSVHYVDRIGWLVGCFASACCAGVLCAVLWARFLEVPALLALNDDIRKVTYVEDRIPTVAICMPPESAADIFLEKLSINSSQTKRIPMNLARLLSGKSVAKDQLVLLDELLASHNLTLPEVIMKFTPGCNEHITKRCRYQKKVLPCEQLFEKELTYWGLCCVMRPDKLSNVQTGWLGRSYITQMLDLVLQCTHGSVLYGCQLVTYYEGEEWVEPETLSAGYYYVAQLRFTAIPENPTSLVENACVHDKKYTRDICILKCAEKACGCSDPLMYKYIGNHSDLPLCPATRISCLRANEYKKYDNLPCQCLPSCKKITTYMVLEPSPITIKHVIDPLYSGLNITPSIVLNLRVNVGHSRLFVLNPTETWLTLLSSLGGVFNMFLGVGLFSALEFLYFLIVKLPVAIIKSSEIDSKARYTTSGPVG